MKLLNLTPHAIVIQAPDGVQITIPPSGQVARVTTEERIVDELDGVPIVVRTTGEVVVTCTTDDVVGLPDEGIPCLVSAMVLAAVPGRMNVYAPDSGATAIRENGQVVAVTRLVAA